MISIISSRRIVLVVIRWCVIVVWLSESVIVVGIWGVVIRPLWWEMYFWIGSCFRFSVFFVTCHVTERRNRCMSLSLLNVKAIISVKLYYIFVNVKVLRMIILFILHIKIQE
jgi:hypothetical protein